MKTDLWDKTAYILVLVGALNWGLIGLFDYNLVAELLGFESRLTDIVYILVGLSAVYLAYILYFAKGRRKA